MDFDELKRSSDNESEELTALETQELEYDDEDAEEQANIKKEKRKALIIGIVTALITFAGVWFLFDYSDMSFGDNASQDKGMKKLLLFVPILLGGLAYKMVKPREDDND